MTRKRMATLALAVPALLALGMSADTSYRFVGGALGITDPVERAALCGVAEAAILGLTFYAWATRSRGPALVAYALVLVQAVPAYALDGGTGGTVRVVFGPVLLAVLLHLLLGIEVRMSGAVRGGLFAAAGRELRERVTARLGLGRRGADSAAIARSRAADRAVALADAVAAARPGGRRHRRLVARLAAAVDAARHGLDEAAADEAERALVARVVRRRSVDGLARIAERHTWGAGRPDTAAVGVGQADAADEVTGAPAGEVSRGRSADGPEAAAVPEASSLVICGDRRVFAPLVPPAAGGDEVTGKRPERLSAEAARVVLESCWSKGTPAATAAKLATRSTSYAKKVFARLDEQRGQAAGQLALVGEA